MSQLFLTVFINTVLEDLGQTHLLFASRLLFSLEQQSRVDSFFKVCGNPSLFHEYRTLSRERVHLPKVDSVVTRGIFFLIILNTGPEYIFKTSAANP
jgi:hypothetical protein